MTSNLYASLVVLVVYVAGCRSDPPPAEAPADRQIELLQRAGRSAYEAGDAFQAVDLYRQALDRALLRADPDAVAETSFDLAAAQARARQYDAALQTLAAADRLTLPATRPQRRLLGAQILFELDRLDDAARALDEADSGNGPSDLLLAYRGLLAAKRGEAAIVREAMHQLDPDVSPTLHARLAGLLAELDGDDAAAATSYEREAGAHRARGNYAATAEAIGRAAAVYERLGEVPQAARCFLLAAQSARMQGLEKTAVAWEARADALMGRADATTEPQGSGSRGSKFKEVGR